MAFRDLTTHDEPEINMRTLLAQGGKFCVHQKGTQWNGISRITHGFKRDVRLKII